MLDEIDIKILELLQKNGRMSHEEISKNLNLTRPAIHRRIYKMEDKGIIDGYNVKIDWEKIGYTVDTYILLHVNTNNFNRLISDILDIKHPTFKIFRCYRITGDNCIMVRVRAKTPSDLTNFYDIILNFEDILDTKTFLVLDTVEGPVSVLE